MGDDITEEAARLIGRAVAATLEREGIDRALVGADNRLSSGSFAEAVSAGLMAGGINVVDIGVVPTPVFYFASRSWDVKGGVMITASHNPPQFNGFKVLRGEGTIYGDDIHEIWKLTKGSLPDRKGGILERSDAVSEYIDYISDNISLARPVRFAVDGGNGTSGIVASDIFDRLGCKPVELFMEPDGRYPNHHPDPTVPENLEDLRKSVERNGLELGIGFDGDSDRIGVIDDHGSILWGDRLLALFARDVLKSNPGATVIYEVKCSQGLEEDILRNGGRPIMWKTGHSLIKKKMREEKALLAGEMSGHIFFADRYFGFDDAVYSACRLLEIVARSDRPLSMLLSDMPHYESTPEIRIDCEDERKVDVVREIRDHFSKTNEVVDVDGARVKFEDGWGLIRPSNTQPVLVLRFEARTRESLSEIKGRFAELLAEYVDTSALMKE